MAIIQTATAAAASAAAGKATTALFDSAGSAISRSLSGPAKTAAIRILASLQGYSNYISETNDRVSTVKTFANPSLPVSLLDHFVTTNLKDGERRRPINQDTLIQRILKRNRIVISATAGYGKSMLMKYIALSLYENPKGIIPIFVELRHLNRISSPNIISYINTLYKNDGNISAESFRQGMKIGAFALILDGFDELNHELRSMIEAQILEMSRDYPKASIVVSGRPDDKFLSWRTFEVFKICPMAEKQVVELVNKLQYNIGTKKRFVSKIRAGLYKSHESFMSTPLLAILMLLTFEENANIPDKMHLFYSKAFETLFHKHDAMKEQYDRQRKSGLQIDDFERIFSVFCLATYVKERVEFTKTELLSTIKSAIEYCGLNVSTENMLFDLEEAVCLLQKEGNSFFFVHRSFQEYFTAVFLSSCPAETRDEFIDQVAVRHWDNVLPMLFDMSADQIEPSWVVEHTDTYLKHIADSGNSDLSKLLARWEGISFYENGENYEIYNVTPGKFSRFISTMHRFYPKKMSVPQDLDFSIVREIMKSDESAAKTTKAGNYKLKSFNFNERQLDILSASGFIPYSNQEYNAIEAIRSRIDEQQAARSKFLDKLFSTK